MLTLLLSTRVFIPPPDCFVAADLSLGAGASPAVGLMLNWGAVNLDGCTESTVRLVPGITKKKHAAAQTPSCQTAPLCAVSYVHCSCFCIGATPRRYRDVLM